MRSPTANHHGGANSRTPAAVELLRALQNVLHEAQLRGIDLSVSFLHFDRQRQGLVSVDHFMHALVDLRLLSPATLWSEHDAEDCIHAISAHKSRVYFSRDDFVAFFGSKSRENNENRLGNAALFTATKSTNKRKMPTKKHATTTMKEKDTVLFSLSNNDGKPVDNEAKMAQPVGSLLPNWAHARSKRALRELEALARKKRPRPLSRATDMAASARRALDQGVPPIGFLEGKGGDDMSRMDEQSVGSSSRSAAISSQAGEGTDIQHDDEAEQSLLLHLPMEPTWRLFDLDHDTTLSYVILTHESTCATPRKLPKMPGAAAHDDDAPLPVMTPFRFTVFLDVFQRIETLEAFFEPLLTHFPRGKILVCGFPTKMRRQTVLNNAFLAAAYTKLLAHVMDTTREWLVQPKLGVAAMPQFVLGFGSGGNVALQVLASEIPLQASVYPSLDKFARAQRGLVLVNPTISLAEPSARAVWNAWRRVLTSDSSSIEWHEMLLRTHFSEFYLTQVVRSRSDAMETFFRFRKHFFQGKSLELLQALVRGVVKNQQNVSDSLANIAACSSAPFGVVLVQGSVAELSPAAQVEVVRESFTTEAASIRDCLSIERHSADSALHVAWLKGGYELLQERPAFLYDLMRQCVLAPVNESVDESLIETTHRPLVQAPRSKAPHDRPTTPLIVVDTLDELHVDPQTDSSESVHLNLVAPEPTAHVISARVRQLVEENGLKWIQQELYDRDLDGSGKTEVILQLYEQVLIAEARQHHELARIEFEKQKRRDQVDAAKRTRQLEERERAAREEEVEKSIKQKEYQAQRQFFEQMEKQKELQAQLLDEQRQMELEDALSLKFNAAAALEQDREGRNKHMGEKVASLEREREEMEQERHQLALQQMRLEMQQKTREDLKNFRKEFEQNQFVCSAVEAYSLDVATEYAQFEAAVAGATTLGEDLKRFYELKLSQMEDSADKRQTLQQVKHHVAEKELTLRNMERVLLKARSNGMIAKAGLGNVRVVAITAPEIQSLALDLDEKRDDMARFLHDQNLIMQQLAWQDTMLQRISVLIKRNEGFRADMLAKLAECADKGNEMVLCVREDIEAQMEKRDSIAKSSQRIRIRLQLVNDEKVRAEAVTTQYFDTRMRVEGVSQRVLRTVLLKELQVEKEELDKRLTQFAHEETLIRTKMKERQRTLDEYATSAFAIEQAKTFLESVVPPAPKVPLARTHADGGDVNTGETEMGSGSLGDRARQKKHSERSSEEKKWIALDFELNFAYYYKHLDAQEVEVIQRHPEYQTNKIKKLQLERLLTLPARNCLALAFFKSPEEMEAHWLLRKYTFSDGEEHFAQLDRAFDLPGSSSTAAAVVSTLEELVSAIDREKIPVLRARSALLLDNWSAKSPPMVILSAQHQQIPPHKSVTHSFQLPSGVLGVLSFTVSVVFQGHFKSTGYQNGRLAAMLYVLPSSTTSTPISAPIPIGKTCSSTDIALCTPHSLGKVVIRHDPSMKPVSADATYQVVLGAPVLTAYSIEISAQTAVFPTEVLRKTKLDALKKQELLPAKKDEILNVFTTIQLSERKKRLARKMANEAKDGGRQAELEMLRQTKLLEADNAAPMLAPDVRKALHMAIQSAEAKFTQQCFLFAQREEEVRDIEAGLKELTKIHAELLEDVDEMERDLVEYREFLPALAAALVNSIDNSERDAAGARVARELNVEYASRYGPRSGKVFWAELSAVKAKLPSMMTPAERVRRKYKKAVDVLEKKEREWILLDRTLYPRKYDWEDRLPAEGNSRMRLHGTHAKLTKDEEQLAVMSQMELERIMKAPWNLLERKEIQVRKIVTRFRDDVAGSTLKSSAKANKVTPTTMVAMLRTQQVSDLTHEEREWRMYDQVLNPAYYPMTLKNLAEELAVAKQVSTQVVSPTLPSHITREDLVAALNTPEEELFKLSSDLLYARNLLLKYDPLLGTNLMEAARIKHAQDNAVTEKVEMDIDARCRLVYAELQRAIANTRNEFMDSSVLHTTLQRFPTKVLRLELEKELDRLLISQISEREQYELHNFLKIGDGQKKKKIQVASIRNSRPNPHDDDDSVSESDSDEEAQIAREQRAQKKLKEAAKHGSRDKVRGKALKTKSIQRQRREIKDALQGKSLDEQRRLLEEQELGVGGCVACRSNPCVWKPYLQESCASVQSRIEVLQEELERIKRAPELVIESTVCLAAVKSGNRAVVMRKADLFDEVTLELKIWDKNLRLRDVDKELHDTFTCKEQYFETQALHGFRQIQQRDKVQRALEREHNLMISNLTAYEVVEDILESMLEGWVFGERESERKAMGFVPSLKREGPLTMHDLRRLEQEKKVLNAQTVQAEEQNVQGIPLDKWKPIEAAAFELNAKNKAVKKGSELDKQLTVTENALKFGIFCMTLMYFRGLSLLKKQKTVWSTSAIKASSSKQPIKSDEKKRMELEARNVAARQKKAKIYDDKARAGQARKQKVNDQRIAAYRRRMVVENQKAKREAHAAMQIQRRFRGFMGRRAGRKWMVRRREIDAQRALDAAAAITLQRAYRGRLGRQKAEEKRIELAEFISQIRAEEAIEEEQEYWKKHRVERIARQVTAFVKKQA